MLDEGLARYFDVKSLGRTGPGFRAEGRFFKRQVSWRVDGFVWHGDPAKVGQFIGLMETAGFRPSAFLGTKATGHGQRDADRELQCSVLKLAQRASGLIIIISMDRPDLQFSSKTVMSTVAKPLEIAVRGRQASAGERFERTRMRWPSALESLFLNLIAYQFYITGSAVFE